VLTVSMPSLKTSRKRKDQRRAVANNDFRGGVFRAVAPLNVKEEKEKFFAQTASYNPQFRYHWSSSAFPSSERPQCVRAFDTPSDLHVENALNIIKSTLRKHGSYEQYEEIHGGRLLDKDSCRAKVMEYLRENRITQLHVRFNSSLSSRGAMCLGKHGPMLCLRWEGCREEWLQGTLDHEVGTHYLRLINERRQPWHGKKGRSTYACANKNPTEEGLASLHTVLSRPGHCMWRSAMNYYAAWKADTMSFCELFQELSQFAGPEACWDFAFRVKRGFEDTGRPGSFAKDQMYLHGALSILEKKDSIDFTALFMGQIALEDVERLKCGGDMVGIQLPQFLQDQDAYLQTLDAIIAENELNMHLSPQPSSCTTAVPGC